MEKGISLKRKYLDQALKNSILLISLLFIIAISLLSNKFLTIPNFLNIFLTMSTTLLFCIGMSYTVITKGIDLSVGAIAYSSIAVGSRAIRAGWDIPMTIVVIILVGAFVGAINGLIAVTLKIYPLLSTLAMTYILKGLSLTVLNGNSFKLDESWNVLSATELLGIRLPIIVALIFLIMAQIVLARTSFGRWVTAVGDNEKTAKEKGINVAAVKFSVYVISGIMSTIAGLFLVSRVTMIPTTLGQGADFTAIIAAVIGGISLTGGKGSIFPGVLIGTFIISMVSNGLMLMKTSPMVFDIANALLVLIVIVLDTVRSNREAAKLH